MKKISFRKVLFFILLIITLFCIYQILYGNNDFIRSNLKSMSNLKQDNLKLENDLQKLENISLDEKKKEISKAIETYQKTKKDYNDLAQTISPEEIKKIEENDIYDIGFLWTIIGNYATEQGVEIKIQIKANDEKGAKKSTQSYASCNLNFIITGNYINITDFIYDLENDDRLSFEINEFKMIKNDNTGAEQGDLKVSLKVREINLYKDNLSEDGLYWENNTEENVVVSTPTNTTNVTNITNTTNTTNTNNTTNSTNSINTTNSTNTTNTTSSTKKNDKNNIDSLLY